MPVHVIIILAAQVSRTGFNPEALLLFDRHRGLWRTFGNCLREIGSSTVQSRCCAGRTKRWFLPAGLDGRLVPVEPHPENTDSRHQPCNFVALTALRSGHASTARVGRANHSMLSVGEALELLA
jgi:hypothetical protein